MEYPKTATPEKSKQTLGRSSVLGTLAQPHTRKKKKRQYIGQLLNNTMNNTSELSINGNRHDRGPARFSSPKICGYYSMNGDGELGADLSYLKYLKSPPSLDNVDFDLTKGHGILRGNTDKKIDNTLRWILQNMDKIKASPGSNRWLKPNFISNRGCLAMLLRTPFEGVNSWIISACKWRGTIYLCAFHTEEQKSINKELDKDPKASDWRAKFEQYVFSDAPDEEPNTLGPVDKTKQFRCVFTSRLENHELLYVSQMVGVSSDKILEEPIDLNGVEFVELKLNRELKEPRHEIRFRKHKLLRWWSHSSLVGSEVLCGFRTDDGIVKKLKRFKVTDMPKESQGFLNAYRCVNFCDDFLNFVKSTVEEDYDKCVYKFFWQPKEKVKFEKVDPGSEYDILPDWFINEAEPYDTPRESV